MAPAVMAVVPFRHNSSSKSRLSYNNKMAAVMGLLRIKIGFG
jgi:hypothetical protein